jgi:O-methyltransferase
MTHEKRFRWHVIYDRIKDIPNPIGAEIGVHRGECSGHLLELHPGLKLYMIDMWSPDTYKGKGDDAATGPYRELYQDNAEENYQQAVKSVSFCDRYVIIPESSLWVANTFNDNVFDFVFIDASHAYEDVKADILAWLPKIKKSGWLFMHDFDNPSFPGVKKAMEDVFAEGTIIEVEPCDYIAAVRV